VIQELCQIPECFFGKLHQVDRALLHTQYLFASAAVDGQQLVGLGWYLVQRDMRRALDSQVCVIKRDGVPICWLTAATFFHTNLLNFDTHCA